MKKTILILSAISVITLTNTSCKKKGCTNSTATNYDANAKKDDGSCIIPVAETGQGNQQQQTQTYIINDTVDFSTTADTYEWSVKLGREEINPTQGSYYSFKSSDTLSPSGIFGAENEKIIFSASNDAWLYIEHNLIDNTYELQSRKFNIGDVVDSNGDGSSIPNGNTYASILEKNKFTTFEMNSTQYLGLKFKENNSYYYGWVKIKTLNNKYSVVIESYTVSTEADKAVTIK